MPKNLYLVFGKPPEGVSAAEFDRWYHGHVRENIVVPGFIDSHVHCESTLVTPGEFDRCVLPRGTTTAICDPHEIANVLGKDGLRYFLQSALGTVMDLRVQLSSCVPATGLETSGARLTASGPSITHRYE